jgi:hypothetical protein
MNNLVLALTVAVVVVSHQIKRDWKEGPRSADKEQVKGANGPEENCTILKDQKEGNYEYLPAAG